VRVMRGAAIVPERPGKKKPRSSGCYP
jgi:hypothetical protein